DPLMSRKGKAIQTRGEGSQVVVDAALDFIRSASARKQPFLAVVWFGSPHAPHQALELDRRLYSSQPEKLQHFYGEITAMDRAIGNLRKEIRRLGIAEDTLFWYNSDNGAIPVGSTGGLSGGKGTLDEGGIRVPAIIEWPNRIRKPRLSRMPCGTVDIYPTLIDITRAQVGNQVQPLDGISLLPLIEGRMEKRGKPLGFWVYPERGIPVRSTELLQELAREQSGQSPAPAAAPESSAVMQRYPEDHFPGPAAWIDGDYKLHRKEQSGAPAYRLFDLAKDPQEKTDLGARHAGRVARMRAELEAWQKSVVRSLNGRDYH
ncbi:MAG: sulfatase-like hydrolase/transferase, partial [Acidobacteria bacterium]|nr:sulfatase-like hydrolase/transferase [Acidobacteriota bacterium]